MHFSTFASAATLPYWVHQIQYNIQQSHCTKRFLCAGIVCANILLQYRTLTLFLCGSCIFLECTVRRTVCMLLYWNAKHLWYRARAFKPFAIFWRYENGTLCIDWQRSKVSRFIWNNYFWHAVSELKYRLMIPHRKYMSSHVPHVTQFFWGTALHWTF